MFKNLSSIFHFPSKKLNMRGEAVWMVNTNAKEMIYKLLYTNFLRSIFIAFSLQTNSRPIYTCTRK